MLACAAFTSDDFPMPRAPHSSALLAGRPSAKRSVFSIRMSRIRSMPLSRPRSTRLTRGTGASRPSGCQTKASALPNESAAAGRGRCGRQVRRDGFERARDPLRGVAVRRRCGAFCRGWPAISATPPWRRRGMLFCGVFSTSLGFLTDAPLSGLAGRPQAAQMKGKWGSGSVAIGTAAAIVRANLPEPA